MDSIAAFLLPMFLSDSRKDYWVQLGIYMGYRAWPLDHSLPS
ncbi:hypothetical protein MGWOODY_Mmi1387 [hydrothermal vent metagenome]|uniref:Uncharacterized protein n=1 Tax=hydrothermal vent metagenome TaxID=652676 RepID=A0A160VJA4_9ZZZZ